MNGHLTVPDEIVIGFFTAVVVALVGAVTVLYWDGRGKRKPGKDEEDSTP